MKNNNIAIIHKEPSYYAEYQNEYSAGNYLLSYFISPKICPLSLQHKYLHSSNYCYSGQYFKKMGGRK